jgi:hypothetical protein
LVPVVRATRAVTGEAVWAQLRSRPAVERPALMRGYLQQLEPPEVGSRLFFTMCMVKLSGQIRELPLERPPCSYRHTKLLPKRVSGS